MNEKQKEILQFKIVIALVIWVGILVPVCAWAIDAPDQSARTLIRSWCKDILGNHGRNNYGQIGLSSTSSVKVEAINRSAGGTEYEFSISTGLLADIWDGGGGTLTTVYVDLPIIGVGTIGDPIDISTAIAGNGLSMTTNYIDVNTGDGITITSDNVVANLLDGGGLDFFNGQISVTPGEVDITQLLNYVAPAGLQNLWETIVGDTGSRGASTPTSTLSIVGGGDVTTAMVGDTLTITATDTDDQTLDEVLDLGHTADYGWDTAVLWTNPAGSTGTSWNSRNVSNHYIENTISSSETSQTVEVNVIVANAAVDHIQWYKIFGSSFDTGSTYSEDLIIGPAGATSIFVKGKSDASPDITGMGQFWVDLATPNIPMFTDDAGTDFILSNLNHYSYNWTDKTVTTLTTSDLGMTWPIPITATGTAIQTGIYITRWIPDFTNVDTITISLYVDGSQTDTWTTNAGVAGSYVGAVSEALTAGTGHYVEVKVKISTQSLGLDGIDIGSTTCLVKVP